ncbi:MULTISPECIES: hypothetical protein [Providencia]|uniref:hypothetical protein n=1 Tax=Providencia TaxID=586 RepID=UPI0024AAAE90|nr:hypothetical protein [Providencia rettgeri]HEM7189741.1 hypothetical protein [Providencia rettgeri]
MIKKQKTTDFIEEISKMRDKGISYDEISIWLAKDKNLVVSAQAVRSAYLRHTKEKLAK